MTSARRPSPLDTARINGLSWDAVFSCEAIGKYKVLPGAYDTVAHFLQLEPSQICMVACHNFEPRRSTAPRLPYRLRATSAGMG